MKIRWSPTALRRIKEIASYIAEDDIPAAHKWILAIHKRVNRIKNFPLSGRLVLEADNPAIREVIDGNYRIIYRIRAQNIGILTVQHTRQKLNLSRLVGAPIVTARDFYVASKSPRGLIM